MQDDAGRFSGLKTESMRAPGLSRLDAVTSGMMCSGTSELSDGSSVVPAIRMRVCISVYFVASAVVAARQVLTSDMLNFRKSRTQLLVCQMASSYPIEKHHSVSTHPSLSA